MLEKYLGSLQGMAGNLLSEANVPADKAPDFLNAGAEAVQENLLEGATSGNMDGVLGFLNGKSDGLLDGIKGSFIDKITGSLGLDSGAASGLVGAFLPKIVEMIRGAFNDSDGNNDESNVMDFLGLDAGGLMDKAKDMLGGKLGGLFS